VQGASTAAADRHGLENSNPAPGNSIELRVIMHHAQIGSISSHFPLDTRISFTSSFFQLSCLLDGIRIYGHSQGLCHGGDDFQAVRLLPAQCCAVAHRSALRRELKRRQKQREKEARRAENSANRPSAPNNDNATEEAANEEDLSPNVRWSY
jgi:hypothetical protein